MNKTITAVVGIVAILGAAFGGQEYLDKRYMSKEDASELELSDLPKNSIIAWYSKDTERLPTGWVICNGKNGTPDLRGKFLRGDHPDFDTEGGRISHNIPDQDIEVLGEGWVQGRTEEHPVGGPEEFQDWGSRNWHILISRGTIPRQQIDLIPPYQEVVFIMKIGK